MKNGIEPFNYDNAPALPSLSEVHGSVEIAANASRWRKFLAFAGPGLLVSVGYMDPGNWATDIAGGSKYEYKLLCVVLISNWIAILMQTLSARLGIVTQRDLAQACRDYYSKPVAFVLWVLCEIAIAACDLAEVLGAAIALKLLFGIPYMIGVCLTAFDVMIVLFLQHRGFRWVEAMVGGLIGLIGVCFAIEIFWSQPNWGHLIGGLVPSSEVVRDKDMLYLAIGILGATVMPHNLYLHSSIVQTRSIRRTPDGLREAMKYNFLDSFVALSLAFFVNAAILVMAAAVFHRSGHLEIAQIEDAYKMLSPLVGATLASSLFAIALLCSGQSSTLTGTLAGQIVMEGFVNIRMKPWLRRMITRLIAIIPAVIVIGIYGEKSASGLLILSQVILSLQLSFAVFPLVMFTSDRQKMGEFANPLWVKILAWVCAILIASLNAWMLWQIAIEFFGKK